jgi:hypothetical protein
MTGELPKELEPDKETHVLSIEELRKKRLEKINS